MSWWTYIRGSVEVGVPGRTQAEKRYVIETVISHLPKVTGSENDMSVHIIQRSGFNGSCSHDEFGHKSDLLPDLYGSRSTNGWLETQSGYIIVVEGNLRDRELEETKRELVKWLCRLAKRLHVTSVLVKVSEYGNRILITDARPYEAMYEYKDNEKRWIDYLLWERDPQSDWPLRLAGKYFDDDYLNEELNRREKWHDSFD